LGLIRVGKFSDLRMRFFLILFLTSLCLTAQDKERSLDLGMEIFRDRCAACHLTTGMGIREMNAPSIAGLPRWYVTDQLRKFRREERGFHKEDTSGHLMKANAAMLDERSIAFVGKHIESLEPNSARRTLNIEISGSPKQLYIRHCASCHGDQAEGNRSERAPPLTSQPDWYLLHQWENFQNGFRIHSETELEDILDKEIESIVAWISGLSTQRGD
jgi:cytochrome c553